MTLSKGTWHSMATRCENEQRCLQKWNKVSKIAKVLINNSLWHHRSAMPTESFIIETIHVGLQCVQRALL